MVVLKKTTVEIASYDTVCDAIDKENRFGIRRRDGYTVAHAGLRIDLALDLKKRTYWLNIENEK